ncbi:lysostaphin resistance A-like protein [Neobacillus sp. SM06]|uniref:CPBP family intramembrane glutamic endopeptidase n=1 Tax=Neobacillus sp. SM06 TaxID=3422492 RepID=UPI003D2E17B5
MKKKYTDMVNELTDRELLFHLYVTQAILFGITLVLGMILFEPFAFFRHIRLDDRNIITVGASAGVLVVVIDILLMKVLPNSFYDDGGLNERIFRNRSIGHIAFIALLVAISEESLFRGIIQVKFGLMAASILFAVIHFRYLFNWFLLVDVVLLSFFIGIVFWLTNNLAVTIVMHFFIDFLLGIYLRWKCKKTNKNRQGC